ncbi:restriction endonuclease subunit S [Staphylococcus sp. GDX8P80P]|uniref:restriction endonuclease subunit S n=1 Tax=Staphylococcus sp. GDX8P80P TaxID=2804104 RepID=UPI001AEBD7AE|nr:restriction endonuclease subunit S [Staphylococcus sp. GDX8P80P]
MSKHRNTPELRFPEFKDEWKNNELGKLLSIISGHSPSYYSEGSEYPLYKVNDLNNNSKFQDYSDLYVEKKHTPLNKKVIIFPKRGAAILLNKIRIINTPGYIDTNLMGLEFNDVNDTEFYYYAILREGLYRIADTSTIPQINNKHILPYKIYSPSYIEKNKLGNFFSKLDRQIELEEQKLAKLEEQKKGYMQQIFSRQFLFENEKGDTDYSWRNFKIKDIFSKIESGNRLPKTNLVEGNIPYVIAQTTNNGVFMHISEDTLDYHKNKLKLFKKGSITISIDNPEAMFIQEMDFFTSNVMRVIHNENLKRGSHIFIMESLKKLTQSYNWSVKFSGPIIMDSTVKFPVYNDNKVNWNVVNKIGDFFNTFEIRINRQSDKIKLLEERKKGLLQKMFV